MLTPVGEAFIVQVSVAVHFVGVTIEPGAISRAMCAVRAPSWSAVGPVGSAPGGLSCAAAFLVFAVAETIGTPGTGRRAAAAIVTVLCALIVEPGRAVLVTISLSRISHGAPS